MIIVDGSVLIAMLRDRTGKVRKALETRLGSTGIAITRFTQFEIMRGCKDQRQWDRLARHLESHLFLEASTTTWEEAARIDYDLKKRGKTVRSGIDCLIAQISLEHDKLLLHNDRDFETIATVRPLLQERFAA